MSERAVITGMGIIAPNGIGTDNYWSAIIGGRSGIKQISRFDAAEFPTKIAGEVADFRPEDFIEKRKARLLSRFAQFALACTSMAVADADVSLDIEDPYRVGIAIGTSLGGKEVDSGQQRLFFEKGAHSMAPFSASQASNNFAVAVIAAEYGIKGANATISTGCTSGLNAIAYAADLVRNGNADIVIAGGSEAALIPSVFEAFCSAGVLSEKNGDPASVSRPFEKNRDGYVLSEGCGIVLIENLGHALRRKAALYAEIAGYGVTNDAYSLLKMEPTGKEVAKAIELAMRSAGLSPKDIQYINAHGSSSPLTDKRETNAIKTIFGDDAYRIPVSSIKSMVGQPLAAAGSFQVIAASLSLRHGRIPPTINYEEKDPECDLDYTPNRGRDWPMDAALVNSFGLGGNNVSMILKRCQGEAA